MSPVELRDIVQKTREIVRDATRWTERNFAEDAAGKWTPVGSEKAVRFNLAGAMIKCSGASAREAMQSFTELLCQAPPTLDTMLWRQARGLTRLDALQLLDWAHARLDRLPREERVGAELPFAEDASAHHQVRLKTPH